MGSLLFNLFINDIKDIFKHSKFLLYVDDLKIYCRVDFLADAETLQHDLLALEACCDSNNLHFNLSKCSAIRFSKKRNVCVHNYFLNTTPLQNVDYIRDLGIIFCSDLFFETHIQTISNCAFKTLGFIMRSCKYFKNISTLKLLYLSLIRPRLKYAAIVWATYQDKHCIIIEKIQHRFLRRVSFLTGNLMYYTIHMILCLIN